MRVNGGCTGTPPEDGCGTGKEWDSTVCECKACVQPEGGCDEGETWDAASCKCVNTEGTPCTETEPAEGCGEGKAWDASTCQCKDAGSTPCTETEPAEGCGEGQMWDSSTCKCAPISVDCSQLPLQWQREECMASQGQG